MNKYSSKGFVWGNCWDGSQGGYRAEILTNFNSKEELLKIANEMLNDGSLDNGMGYESLTGALLEITETDTREIDGKDFTHEETEFIVIGELNSENEAFLTEAFYS